jgi:hypothetical protein
MSLSSSSSPAHFRGPGMALNPARLTTKINTPTNKIQVALTKHPHPIKDSWNIQTEQLKAHYLKFSAKRPNHPFMVPEIPATEAELQKVKRIRDFATQYRPRQLNGISYPIHNEFFQPFSTLPEAKGLDKLLNELNKKGSFSLLIHPQTGLVQTSETYNTSMHRQWFNDSCIIGLLQQEIDPKSWQKSMITNAAALNKPQVKEVVRQVVKNPDWYRKTGVMNGIFHIYYPKTVVMNHEGLPIVHSIQHEQRTLNQKRLESQALMLLNLVNTIRAGLVESEKKPWGFTPHQLFETKAGAYITNAIGYLTRYLLAVNTNPALKRFDFRTPSTSSWEEVPFDKGMSSDTALTVLAMERLYQLLYVDSPNPQIEKIRGEIEEKLPKLSESQLQLFIREGRDFVDQRITHPLLEGGHPSQTPLRGYDTTLCQLAASDYRFIPDNLLEDANTRVKLIIQTKEALLKENGMLRYPEFSALNIKFHDSYLNRGSHFPIQELKRIFREPTYIGTERDDLLDPSRLEDFQTRQEFSTPEHAAQWGLGLSASLQALAKAKQDVLTAIKQQGQPSDKATTLLKTIDSEMLDVLNRTIAAIPGPLKPGQRIIGADGRAIRPYLLREAYEFVPDNTGNLVAIPGAHSAPCHAAQLYDGLQKMKKAAQMMETNLPNGNPMNS